MNRLDQLKSEAIKSCETRGHIMQDWHHCGPTWEGSRTTAYAYCMACSKQVVVKVRPAANDIEIGGKAVALNCIK